MYYLPPDTADRVRVSRLPGATFDNVQDYINFFGDRVIITGGEITATLPADGTVAVAPCTAWCKATNSDLAIGVFLNFAGVGNIALTDLTANIIYLDYNAGTPQVVMATSYLTFGFQQDHILLGAVYRNGNAVHIVNSDRLGIQGINRTHLQLVEHGPHRTSGMVTLAAGVRNIAVTAGVLHLGLIRIITPARDTTPAGGDDFTYWYYDGSLPVPAWVAVPGSTQISNAQWNDVALGLVAFTPNRYGVHWVFMDFDGHLHIVYGQGDYTAALAENADVPAALPNVVTMFAVIVAKIICQQGVAVLTVTYPWTIPFVSALSNDHSLLINLAADDHLQYLNIARHDLVARHPLAVLDPLVCSEAEADARVLVETLARALADFMHETITTPPIHGSTVAANINTLIHRDAAGRAKIINPAVNADIDNLGARDAAITAHAALTTGTHGVTGTIVGTSDVQVFTNKTLLATTNVVEETYILASSTTPIPSGGSLRNFYALTALAANATFMVPSGTPANANKIIIRIKDNGAPRTLGWNAIYRAVEFALPATTTPGKTIYLRFIYNSADSKWDMVAINVGAVPCFHVTLSGDQPNVVSGVATKVLFNSEIYDTQSDFAAFKFTPSIPGKYLHIVQLRIDALGDGDRFDARIYKNGLYAAHMGLIITGAAGMALVHGSYMITANGSSDFFEIYTLHTFGANKDIDSANYSTYWMGFRIIE